VILHNIIIEDERDLNLEFFFNNVGTRVKPTRNPNKTQAFLEIYQKIENSDSVGSFSLISFSTSDRGMVALVWHFYLFRSIFIYM
jgi:hypothetical protein